jgi:acyl transferase domain-containing protein/acyl carrier protein
MNQNEILQELRARRMTPDQAKRLLLKDTPEKHRPTEQSAAVSAVDRAAPSSVDRAALLSERVAIVGMAGRYPGANDLDQFWANLAEGRDSVREIPASRWEIERFFDERREAPGKVYCKWLGALDGVENFDSLFFNIAPAEARAMDPQHRLFLQVGYHAFEDAGYNPKALNETRCGVYLGLMGNEYASLTRDASDSAAAATAHSPAIGAARLAYHLNLKGPAIAIDTACSSSLVATHLACQALRSREVDMALVGGASLYLTPESYITMCAAGMLSADGKCKAFDDRADGFVPGEGVGALVLKRLEDAIAHGDRIHAVIIGSGINQDGRTNGITAPSLGSQADLVRDVYARYRIEPASISFVETHGTGTRLGDPVELEALATAFGSGGQRMERCALGSVKSNIGHASAAAGVAGLHKVLLSMRHAQLAPTLHFTSPNRHFDFASSPFYVNTELRPWVRQDAWMRRAAISSFGFSGTNAHLVVEEWINPPRDGVQRTAMKALMVLSARSAERLRMQACRLREYLQRFPDTDLTEAAFTLQTAREGMAHRLAFVAGSVTDVIRHLDGFETGSVLPGLFAGCVNEQTQQRDLEAHPVSFQDLEAQIEQEDLNRTAECWVKGGDVPWLRLYSGSPPRRISLPGYPFLPQRHWIAVGPSGAEKLKPNRRLPERAEPDVPQQEYFTVTPQWEGVQPDLTPPSQKRSVLILGGSSAQQSALLNVCPGARATSVAWQDGVAALAAQLDLDGADHVIWIAPGTRALSCSDPLFLSNQRDPVIAFFRLVKALLLKGCGERAMEVTVLTARDCDGVSDVSAGHAAVHGLAQSMARELTNWRVRVVDLDTVDQWPSEAIVSLSSDPGGDALRHRKSAWYRQMLVPSGSGVARESAFRERGVYVVIGGAGGIGALWSEYMIRRYDARIVWIGRRPMDEGIEASCRRLGRLGIAPHYVCADATDLASLERARSEITHRVGHIDGLIHSAMVMMDKSLENMQESNFESAFAAKADVSALLARVFATDQPGLVLFFSSLESFAADAGQSNYAAGCCFSDALAHQLSREWNSAVKVMNWGFWGDVGATRLLPEVSRRRIAANGVGEIEPDRAMEALESLVSGSDHQLGFVRTSRSLLKSGSLHPTSFPMRMPEAAVSPARPESLHQRVAGVIRRIVLENLGLGEGDIDDQSAFADYGVDSINGVRIVRQINLALGTALPTTCLFDYTSIRKLTAHVIETGDGTLESRVTAAAGGRSAPASDARSARDTTTAQVERASPLRRGPIAIIGKSGQFPKARDLRELWEMLALGRDVTEEVSRWAMPHQAGSCVRGGFLSGIDRFDAQFFNIAALEARYMDPQHRLLLQHAWTALEDAGHGGEDIIGSRCGIYIGSNGGDYAQLFKGEGNIPPQSMWGNAVSVLSSRIAYYLDLQGPAITVDTACSSSMVALHLACQGLWTHETEMALAGGVWVQCAPGFYQASTRAGMLSPTGTCRPFDAEANGFVPSEGVGVLVLKRLEDALRDGDHVHGVIRGSGINQDGASNGITAPSALAQERLENEVYDSFDIDPADIHLVEAHGTGTILGDPIEFQALSRAFRRRTEKTGYCALGSIKGNIGHAAAAAGVAGIIKVLLCLEHQKIPPAAHFTRPNPHIDLADSPFYINTQLRDWLAPPGEKRCAAVSSFGLSGTNAHVVIEEPPAQERTTPRTRPFFIPLSAQTNEQLREYVLRLVAHCESTSAIDCGDMSFTLCVGRRHLGRRLVCIAANRHEITDRLRAWLADGSAEGVYCSDENPGASGTHGADADHGDAFLRKARGTEVEAKRTDLLRKAALLYVGGQTLHMPDLFDSGFRRISLPTYPFAGRRHWVSQRPTDAPRNREWLQMVSNDSGEITFSCTLTGREGLIANHVAMGKRVVPGLFFIELAQAAVAQAGAPPESDIELSDTVWLRVMELPADGRVVRVILSARAGGGFDYRIVGAVDGATFCQGRGIAGRPGASRSAVDIPALRERCQTVALMEVQLSEAAAAAGTTEGNEISRVEELRSASGEILVRLRTSQEPPEGSPLPVLDPDLISGVVLALAGRSMATAAHVDLSQPGAPTMLLFALESVAIVGRGKAGTWIWIRRIAYTASEAAYDIDVCDEGGSICVSIRGLRLRRAAEQGEHALVVPAAPKRSDVDFSGALVYLPDCGVVSTPESIGTPRSTETILLVGGTPAQHAAVLERFPLAARLEITNDQSLAAIAEQIRSLRPVDHIFWLPPDSASRERSYEPRVPGQVTEAVLGLRFIKALLEQGYGTRPMGLTVVTSGAAATHGNEPINLGHAGIHGLIGAVAKEQPAWAVRLVDIDPGSDWPLDTILRLPGDPRGEPWLYRDTRWLRRNWIRCWLPPEGTISFRRGGVYLVVGGAGAIGEVFSEYLIRHYGAQMVWIGRRMIDEAVRAKIERLSALGPAPAYYCADAGELGVLQSTIQSIEDAYGTIHGVVHAALVMAGSDLAHMDEDRFRNVVRAKADVGLCLSQVFRRRAIDFVLFFSSIQSIEKSARQSNYAAGCTFADALAHEMRRTCGYPVKVINWGYWAGIGFVAGSSALRNWIAQAGMGSINPDDGMVVLERLLGGPFSQLAYLRVEKAGALRDFPIAAEGIARSRNRTDVPLAAVQNRLAGLSRSPPTGAEAPTEFQASLVQLLAGQLFALGLTSSENIAEWKQGADVRPLYARWLQQSVRVLMHHGYLGISADVHRTGNVAPVTAEQAWRNWDERRPLWMKDANLRPLVQLAEAALRALPDVLRGARLATEVLFPRSSTELVEGIYRNNPIPDFFNTVLADAVCAYIEEIRARDFNAKIRILEVGAGTGGTTTTILKRIMSYASSIEEYCFSDVSKLFLLQARRRLSHGGDFLRYQLLDVEEPLLNQGIEPGRFDIVVAANVIHATKDVRRTVRHVKAALKCNGLLLLNEICGENLFAHLTFGLLQGWWLYEDPGLRTGGSPALHPRTWLALLKEEGFKGAALPLEQHHALGQQIVLAQSDGYIRLPSSCLPANEGASQRAETGSVGLLTTAEAAHTRVDTEGPMGDPEPPHDPMLPDTVRHIILVSVAESLGMSASELEGNKPFAEYGMDSIMAVRAVEHLNESLGIELSSTCLFDYSTVDVLLAHLVACHAARISNHLGRALSPEGQAKSAELPPASAGPEHKLADPHNDHSGTMLHDPIAVIGISARYGRADGVRELWEAIAGGVELIETATRWDLESAIAGSSVPKEFCRRGSFLNGIDLFDPLFFNISGLEAEHMDPHQRLFLEEVWKALEDAGYAGTAVRGRNCGVYAGYNGGDYPRAQAGPAPASAMWGSASSILSARIAYYLDLKGPAITIDTACSSSLVAIHLACQGLRTGETDMAVAGGIALHCTSGFYLAANRAGMLSPSGRCFAFDERADGFVPGEGVGVVILKRLSEAIADGDQIYGVIRGSAINQDGTTNGITAPSAISQESLETKVYQTYGINPRHIELIECHGTGTRLGDPIEFHALSRAFARYTDEKQFCALGSVKTNIGHTTAAAGVAGMIKILMSLKCRAIPPSLNFERGNPHINFADSPFYVSTSLREWTTSTARPRLAAVSSFGISGTNAHAVVEEPPAARAMAPRKPAFLVPLSARSPVQLRQQVQQLLDHCETAVDVDLGSAAFTLLIGRMHFEHRLACVARNVVELCDRLRVWMEKARAPQLFVGTRHGSELQGHHSLTRVGNQCLRECREGVPDPVYLEHLCTVAELHVQGYDLDFGELYRGHPYSRVSLPTYPFARERYWVNEIPRVTDLSAVDDNSQPGAHPLLRRDTSVVRERRFTTTFSGEESYFADHIVHGHRMLAGATCLEIARAAVARTVRLLGECRRSGGEHGNQPQIRLHDVAWQRPVHGAAPVELHVRCSVRESGDADFEIFSNSGAHVLGGASALESDPPPRLDLDTLTERCVGQPVLKEKFYADLEALGFKYGPTHRTVEKVRQGTDGRGVPFVIAHLRVPEPRSPFDSVMALHPGLLDGALQASLAMGTANRTTGTAGVPFALDSLEMFEPCPSVVVAYIGFQATTTGASKLDVLIVRPDGSVCVRLMGLVCRTLPAASSTVHVAASSKDSGIVVKPRWFDTEGDGSKRKAVARRWQRRTMILCDWSPMRGNELTLALHERDPNVEIRIVSRDTRSPEVRLLRYAAQLLQKFQAISSATVRERILLQVVFPCSGDFEFCFGLEGLMRTIQLENPDISAQLVGIDPEGRASDLAAVIETEAGMAEDIMVRRLNGRRQVIGHEEVLQKSGRVISQAVANGVYLVTGGNGGVGQIICRHLAGPGITLIVTGRSPASTRTRDQIQWLQERGATAEYCQTDVTEERAVTDLVKGVVLRHGSLDVVIHAAGVIQDSFLKWKPEAQLLAVMAPKVRGVANLDHATRNLPLKSFVLFSSLVSTLGGVGQADYACANSFLGCFAPYRNELTRQGKRSGKTVSIEWPQWEEGGMRADADRTTQLEELLGLASLSNEAGLAAFDRALQGDEERVIVMPGNPVRLRAVFTGTSDIPQSSAVVDGPGPAAAAPEVLPSLMAEPATDDPARFAELFQKRAGRFFRDLFAATLRIPAERIETDAPLEQYGVDSLIVVQFTRELEKSFGSLSKTLLFEYRNLGELTRYFLAEHGPRLRQVLGMEARGIGPQSTAAARKAETVAVSFATRDVRQLSATQSAPEIAIVGIAGRYPNARSLRVFWENLCSGRDCVIEIPQERWDSNAYFDPQRGLVGKTYTKWGGFLEGIDEFDPLFFNISPKEAKFMDPQERLFLQCVHEAIEEAGYTRATIRQSPESAVGVFVGVMYEEYQLFAAQEQVRGRPFALSGSAASVANRVSHFCDFHGPSLAVDTMCSSSLAAIHLACQSLRSGECSVAIAGGVNVSIHPNKYFLLAQGQFASSRGRCASFGAEGDGYVPGEGVGAVVLKPLARAIEDGDHIHAVIKASTLNHGGKTNGYTVPDPNAQAAVVAAAISQAGITARAISYVEAHGTGTALGDPIEIAALAKAFAGDRSELQFCAIGSVKSNIGHCEGAAGIAGLTKVILQMRHGVLAPSLHAEEVNPNIDFSCTPFRLQRELSPWCRPAPWDQELPRIAGVSSFGAGGTNAHLIVQEFLQDAAIRPNLLPETGAPTLIVLSAHSVPQLRTIARNLSEHLRECRSDDSELPDVAYTLQVGREAFDHRMAFVAATMQEALLRLDHFAEELQNEDIHYGEVRSYKSTLGILGGDDANALALRWIAAGQYDKLAALWTKGGNPDWHVLASGSGRKRVSLPTYPFARERYWIDVSAAPQVAAAAAGSGSGVGAEIESNRTASRPVQDGVSSSQRWPCLITKAWDLKPSREAEFIWKRAVIIANREESDLAAQLATHFEDSIILFNEDLPRHPSQRMSWESFDTWLDLSGCGNGLDVSGKWLPVLQHWLAKCPNPSFALCVTRGLEEFKNSDVSLSGAPRAGLYRMLQSEYKRIRSRHLDVETAVDGRRLIDHILAELSSNSDEAEVCYREGERYEACLKVIAEQEQMGDQSVVHFPEDHVLWITGGTRGLGFVCAAHFAGVHQVRRMVLSGRERFPPREHWESSARETTSIAAKIRMILQLEADHPGLQVRVSSVSLTDSDALKAELEEIHWTLGPVAGLLHCAGMVDPEARAFVRKDPEKMEAVLSPKIQGLERLLLCISGEPLRWCIFFSSVTAAMPVLAVGQSDYALANSFMDYRAQVGTNPARMVSLQWPSWKEAGFGEVSNPTYARSGLLSLENSEALSLLDCIIAGELTGSVIPALTVPGVFRAGVLAARSLTADRSLEEKLRERLRHLVAEQLGIELHRVQMDKSFQDYGADSIALTEMLRPVSAWVGERLDPSTLFEHTSIQSFAEWLARKYSAVLVNVPIYPSGRGPPRRESKLPTEAAQLRPVKARSDGPDEFAAAGARQHASLAVVGLSCRLPAAEDLEAYWELLKRGESAIGTIPVARWGRESPYIAATISNPSMFDPGFFQIPINDARALDPQAVLVLEESLKAWHHAGYSQAQVKGAKVGVYFGARSQHRPESAILSAAEHPARASGPNYLAANVSWFFDLHGPSVVVDTACSSALVAMSMAGQALLGDEINAAVVGGVSLLETEASLEMFARRGILRYAREFHLFDGRDSGTILGEGAGVVILKTLKQAIADGDTIYAVVSGIAVNNDGRTAGPTAPNLAAQKDVMQAALDRSGLQPEQVGHVEVNGSGSEISDLLELKAIQSVYRSTSKLKCELGSMKPNIGHPLCAEGIASFIKVVLSLHRRQRVPFLSALEPMRHYDLEASPFRFSRCVSPWPQREAAAINCFADGGTNAHVIVEAWDSFPGQLVRHCPLAVPSLNRIDLRTVPPSETGEETFPPPSDAPSQEHGAAKDFQNRPRFWKRISATKEAS